MARLAAPLWKIISDTAPAAVKPQSAAKLAFNPAVLVRPRDHSFPYCTPTQYRNSSRPRVPSRPGGAELRRERAACQTDEQHRSRAERKPFQVDLTHQVSDGDGQEQRRQR